VEREDPGARGEELRAMFSRARAFTEELLRENERLRFRVAGLARELEQRAAEGATREQMSRLEEDVRALRKERDDLIARFRQVEATNREVAGRHQEIEAQNNQLANLYVASYQLHTTLNFAEVLDTVKEILINLVGADGFAIFWVEKTADRICRIADQGMSGAIPDEIRLKRGPLRSAAENGESYYANPIPEPSKVDAAHPIACVPLKIDARPIGVIAIYRLLGQKNGFTPLDFELFTLLAGHAATALFSSKLYEKSERKLHNLQGFIDMLTAPTPS
jgi:hypothetical protein